MQNKTAILGTAYGYPIEQLEPFLRSCHDSIPTADVFLFTDRVGGHDVDAARRYCPNCQLMRPRDIGMRRHFKKLKRGHRLLSLILLALGRRFTRSDSYSQLITGAFGVAIARYLWYFDWIRKSHAAKYERILLCDTRDVILQSDPFRAPFSGRLFCGQEPIALQACPVNSPWFRICYGDAGLKQIAGYPVLCSGVTGGAAEAIEEYLAAMCLEIMRLGGKVVRGNGLDQAIHNHLLRFSDLATQVDFCDRHSSRLVTMHYMRAEEIDVWSDQSLRTKQGELISIVHQYDRHPGLCDTVNRCFRSVENTTGASGS
ncbi:MAG TPA: hypothetical protein PLY87_03855 [Planctomycetaceae bacterium]|nr:hypothetical protein [Planctomycetaceae bacterium]HRA88452.1 hypothetical protein [Planctomycetaceae bacterium]